MDLQAHRPHPMTALSHNLGCILVRIVMYLQATTVVRQLIVLKTNCINCFYCTFSDATVVIQAGEVARRRRSQSRSRRNSRSGSEPPPLFVEPNKRFSQEREEFQEPAAQCKFRHKCMELIATCIMQCWVFLSQMIQWLASFPAFLP